MPDDYDHSTALKSFRKKHRQKCDLIEEINDQNYPNPTRVLRRGDKLHVRAFKQIVDGTTTSEERMAFLATQKAIHTGAQGASLVFEQKRDQLPEGKWYASFDEKDRLWSGEDSDPRGPNAYCYWDGALEFSLGYFGHVWYGAHAFLCFCDIESSVA